MTNTNPSNFLPETHPYQPRNQTRATNPEAPDPNSCPLPDHPKWTSFLQLLGRKLCVTPAEHRAPFLELLKEVYLL